MCSILLSPYDVLVYTGRATFFRGSGKEERGVGTIAEPRTQKEADLLKHLYHYTTISKRPSGQVYLRGELRRIPLPRTRVNKGKKGKGASYATCPFSSSLLEQ